MMEKMKRQKTKPPRWIELMKRPNYQKIMSVDIWCERVPWNLEKLLPEDRQKKVEKWAETNKKRIIKELEFGTYLIKRRRCELEKMIGNPKVAREVLNNLERVGVLKKIKRKRKEVYYQLDYKYSKDSIRCFHLQFMSNLFLKQIFAFPDGVVYGMNSEEVEETLNFYGEILGKIMKTTKKLKSNFTELRTKIAQTKIKKIIPKISDIELQEAEKLLKLALEFSAFFSWVESSILCAIHPEAHLKWREDIITEKEWIERHVLPWEKKWKKLEMKISDILNGKFAKRRRSLSEEQKTAIKEIIDELFHPNLSVISI